MAWAFAALAAVSFVEILTRVPFLTALATYRQLVGKVMATIRSRRISDHWKERVLPRYAAGMLRATMGIAACLAAAFAPIAVLWFVAGALNVPFAGLALSWAGIVGMTVIAMAWVALRKRLAR